MFKKKMILSLVSLVCLITTSAFVLANDRLDRAVEKAESAADRAALSAQQARSLADGAIESIRRATNSLANKAERAANKADRKAKDAKRTNWTWLAERYARQAEWQADLAATNLATAEFLQTTVQRFLPDEVIHSSNNNTTESRSYVSSSEIGGTEEEDKAVVSLKQTKVLGEVSKTCNADDFLLLLDVNEAEESVDCDFNAPFLDSDEIIYGEEKATIKLSVTDESEIAISKYSWTSSDDCWENGITFTDGEDIEVTAWGESDLYLCAEDVIGNRTDPWSKTYIADNADPTCIITSDIIPDPNWYKTSVTVNAKCEDAEPGSGCDDEKNVTEFIISEHGKAHTFEFKDRAGNVANCTTKTSQIDTLAPNCLNVRLEPSGWVDETETVQVKADCLDKEASGSSGMSKCEKNTYEEDLGVGETKILTVEDQAGNTFNCEESDLPKIHDVEIRGLKTQNTDPASKTDLLNQVRQNVADLTRNGITKEDIDYYEADISLDIGEVGVKRTIIVQGGNLTITGDVTYADNGILGIIVLKDQEGNGGDVYISSNVKNIHAILLAEGVVYSEGKDLTLEQREQQVNQLYWKGSVISDNTVGGSVENGETIEALSKDLKYFRSYYPADDFENDPNRSGDPQESKAPMIIEYDSSVQQNVPYGFETPSNLYFGEK